MGEGDDGADHCRKQNNSSIVRILEYVAEGKSPPPATKVQKPKPGKKAPVQPGANKSKSRKSLNQWKWTAESDAKGEQRKTTPIKSPDGRTIHVAGFEVSGDDKPPVVLLPESRLSVSGRLATKCPVYFGITINHPNGDFAGRFQTVRPADTFRNGEDFTVTLDLQDFQLEPSLAGMKDKLPSEPFHFVVESIWSTALAWPCWTRISLTRLLLDRASGYSRRRLRMSFPV